MAADDVAQTRSKRILRWIALALLAAGAVAGAIAFRRRQPGGMPLTVAPSPRPVSSARVEPAKPAAPAMPLEPPRPAALAEPLGGPEPAPQPVDDVVDETADGYDGWTVADLRARARELGVTGYSKLRKVDLVAALRERDAPTP